MTKKLLLLSSSRVADTPYLEHALPFIQQRLADVNNIVFVPFAGVSVSYDDYSNMVAKALSPLGLSVTGLHQFEDKQQAIEEAEAVLVGGGNTFHLLAQLYNYDLLSAIRDKVNAGMPYIGWSAGSNIAGLSIKTTNDMPIIEPKSFDALQLVNYQLNPHYTDYTAPGHNGETREQRLQEFMCLNPDTDVIGIVEGTGIMVDGEHQVLVGHDGGFHFKASKKSIIEQGSSVSAWLTR